MTKQKPQKPGELPQAKKERKKKPPAEGAPHVSGKPSGTKGVAYGGVQTGAALGFGSIPTFSHQDKPPALWSLDSNGKLTLGFHNGQSRVWNSMKRFLFMLAGTQGGGLPPA